ncbi:hypothetical protein [Pseudomonas asiatica]|uniref:Uncharacterized protein n=1 Tax=Pseudomonas asiatica TaxID=2219225 RepID=A0ABU5L4A9_9PSED|nr:hypothetical protein [Pseudomonas asiatica]MDZ5740985.1 hypothetical protein [Pseudomonas asiatica]MDZ5746306.1 hypothetical protein [Pseudomonas asiatica]MDZ5751249.1 hypothetical protein [Pseudomonas asiatica]MDZ5756283.1 hypothetical protein [Pseudomonas asiatica]
MEWLSGFLEKWKVLNILMFVITTTSTLMGIVLGWKQFYHDYLSVQVSMPLWMLFLIVLIVFISLLLIAARKKTTKDRPLEVVADMEFGVQRIDVNGKHFKRCKFQGSEILLSVSRGFGLEDCQFSGSRFTWGESESKVIEAMTAMYKEPSLRYLIEGSFENVKKGTTPKSVNPV